MKEHYWLVVIDRGDGSITLVHEGSDIEKVYLRIGQLALSLDIEQITVYRDSEEYRRYILKRKEPILEVQESEDTHK